MEQCRTVLMVSRLVPNKLGAYERFTMAFAEKCQREGLTVDFLFDGAPLEEVRRRLVESGAGISVLSESLAGASKGNSARLAEQYWALVARHHYRLVSFSYCEPLATLGALAGARARLLSQRPRIVWHQHSEQQPPRGFVSRRLSLLKLASTFMDRVCPVYEQGAEIMRARHIDSRKIQVIGNGVCRNPISVPEKEKLRRELGVGSEGFLLFSAASLIARKNVAMMIRALAKALDQVQNLVLVVAGEGDQRTALTDLARKLNVESRVRLVGLRNDAAELAASSDLCLMTSYSEALPFFCLEAFAAGRTIIATPAGGIPEIVEDGVNGLLVGFDDHQALADQIARLARDPGRRAEYEHAACETYHERYTLDHMVEAYFGYYTQLLGISPQLAAPAHA